MVEISIGGAARRCSGSFVTLTIVCVVDIGFRSFSIVFVFLLDLFAEIVKQK
jgi:hypothetical protein